MSDTPKINLVINQGATFRQKFTWQDGVKKRPINLTDFVARMQVRASIESEVILLELGTTEGAFTGITLGGALGTVSLYLSATETSVLTWAKGVYDLELTSPANEVFRLVGGSVVVSPEVTR